MARIGLAAPPLLGHVHPMIAIGRVLAARGHDITFIFTAAAPAAVAQSCFGHRTIGDGSNRIAEISARPGGLMRTIALVSEMARTTGLMADGLLPRLRAGAFDLLLVDQLEPGAALAALATRTPYLSVANALPLNRAPGVPPYYAPWLPGDSNWARERDRGAFRVYDLVMSPVTQVIRSIASAHGLRGVTAMEDCLSEISVAQVSPGFDFPRPDGRVVPLGPFRHGSLGYASAEVDADGPFVAASFGSLFGWRFDLFMKLALASRDVGARLVIAHGGRLGTAQIAELRQLAQVHAFVDQAAILRAAKVAVTHAGMNTVMDIVCAGRPCIALPFAYDQPGVAARIAYAGTGLRISPPKATRRALRSALADALENQGYTTRSQALADIAAKSGGAERAADIASSLL